MDIILLLTRQMLKLAAHLAPIVLLIVSTSLGAQTVHPGSLVRVRAPGAVVGRFEGAFIGRFGDTVLLGNEARGPVSVPLGTITRLEVSRGRSWTRGVLRGVLWGTAVGVLLAATYDPKADGPRGEFIGAMISGGAQLGALIGAFVPKRRWSNADPQILLTASPAFERGVAVVSDSGRPSSVSRVVSGLLSSLQPKGPSPREGATPTVEIAAGVSVPQLPQAEFPGLTASLAINRAWSSTRGIALIGELDARYLSSSAMAGPRIYGRTEPLFANLRTMTYFGQLLVGSVAGATEGVLSSHGGFGIQPGAGVDFGAGVVAYHVEVDYRHVAGSFVEDSRLSPPRIDVLSGPRVFLGVTWRIQSR